MIRTVPKDDDFRRVAALPRRRLDLESEETRELVQGLNEMFLTPAARNAGVSLLAWQALALVETVEVGGGVIWAPVGLGKSWFWELAPLMHQAERPLFVSQTPAGKALKEHQDLLELGLKLGPPAQSITRNKLSRASGLDELYRIEPDLILINEHSDYSNAGTDGRKPSGAVLALDEYIADKRPTVIAGDGTPDRWSMLDYWHILMWCLKERAPLPLLANIARLWASATDDKTGWDSNQDAPAIVMPGPLGRTAEEARAWLSDRVTETPGILSLDYDSAAGIPLTLEQVIAPECPDIDAAYRKLFARDDDAASDTDPEDLAAMALDNIPRDPFTRWRKDLTYGAGYYTYWDPEPPKHWRDAFVAKNKLVYDVIMSGERNTKTGRPLRTEQPVLKYYADDPVVREWQSVRKDFDPIKASRTAWISSKTLEFCARWLTEGDTPGVVWVGSPEFGRVLAQMTGLPYYGDQGIDRETGLALYEADPHRGMIVSWNANKKDYNLQAWSRALVVQPPPSARWLEQLFGRHHRQGQLEHTRFYLLVTCGLVQDIFEKAIEEAKSSKSRTKLTQKILRAEIVRARAPVTATNRYRWTRESDQRTE